MSALIPPAIRYLGSKFLCAEWIIAHFPPQIWRFAMQKKGLAKILLSLRFAIQAHQYDLFASQVNIDAYLERHPCFFDQL